MILYIYYITYAIHHSSPINLLEHILMASLKMVRLLYTYKKIFGNLNILETVN